jgi:Flp pilus assembly protein TadG
MRALPPHQLRQPRRIVTLPRRGTAVAELAILLPFLAFLFVAGVDFARVFYDYLTVTNCACNGATYASIDAAHAGDTAGIQAAALSDATDLKPTPTVASATGTDKAGNSFVQVTVTYKFQTIANFPGIPSALSIKRTVQMRVAPP